MFGAQPGIEQRQGKMNEHVVTKLESRKATYWVMHTRGESPVSILISAVSKDAEKRGMTQAQALNLVDSIVRQIETNTLVDSRDAFDRVKDDPVFAWGTNANATLDKLVTTARTSCVLAYTKVDDDE